MTQKRTPFVALVFLTIFCFSGISLAANKHTALALEHVASAKVHADRTDTDQFAEDLKEALHHAEIASKLHDDRREHISTATEHIKTALELIDKKDNEKAKIHAEKAVMHMHMSFDD